MEYKLIQEILAKSVSKNWDMAKTEWNLDGISYIKPPEEPYTCLCGHYPIRELCYIKNSYTGTILTVGNCCIDKFTGLNSKKYFDSLKRVKKDLSNPFNADFIRLMYEKFIISKWERDFYLSTWRKRHLTGRQFDKRIQINNKIIIKEAF